LLLEIIDSGITEFVNRVGRAAADTTGDASDRIRAMVQAHVGIVAEDSRRTLIVFHQWRYLSATNQVKVRDQRRKYEQLFTSTIRRGVAEGRFAPDLDVRTSVFALLGALNWTPEWLSPDGPVPVAELGARLADAILLGMEKRADPSRAKR
jgi:AcrR family transcriptional regulator